jgi:single-stranded-DNA-specific exonuclease
VSLYGEFGHGSVRSVPAIHAVLALDSARDLLVRYGGHPAAAGFTVRRENLPELARRLADYVGSAARADDLIPELSVDAVVRADELSRGLAEQLQRLGPFGKGNPEPLLWVRGLWPQAPRRMGERHLRFRAGPVDATWWHGAEHLMALGGPIDLIGSLGLNHYQGQTTARLTVEDLRPSRAAP